MKSAAFAAADAPHRMSRVCLSITTGTHAVHCRPAFRQASMSTTLCKTITYEWPDRTVCAFVFASILTCAACPGGRTRGLASGCSTTSPGSTTATCSCSSSSTSPPSLHPWPGTPGLLARAPPQHHLGARRPWCTITHAVHRIGLAGLHSQGFPVNAPSRCRRSLRWRARHGRRCRGDRILSCQGPCSRALIGWTHDANASHMQQRALR